MVAIKLKRRYVARFPDGSYKTVHWGCPPDDRIQVSQPFEWDTTRNGPFTTPASRQHYSQTHYYHAYTEVLWSQLQSFQVLIGLLRTQLQTALQTEAGITAFSAAFVALLGTPPSDVEKG